MTKTRVRGHLRKGKWVKGHTREAKGSRRLSKKTKSVFFPPKYRYLADIVDLTTPARARKAVDQLETEFRTAKTKEKKLRIMRATNLAATRAIIGSHNKRVSIKEQKEYAEIGRIYRTARIKMSSSYGKLK